MDVRIDPEPSPEERAAILAALEQPGAAPEAAADSAWWRAGLPDSDAQLASPREPAE